jgi:HEAT repeat protein
MRHTALLCGAAALLGLGAGAASAQSPGGTADAARQRYEDRAKGTNLDDFVRKLASQDPVERIQGVRGLGESNDGAAIEYLVQALGDQDVRVKAKAVEMLGRMRASEATPVLVQHLFLVTTEEKLKQRILAALGEIGDPSAAPAILDLLERDLDQATRGTAIFALGEIGASEATEPLRKIARTETDPTLRRLANEAVAKVTLHEQSRAREAAAPVDTFLRPNPEEQPQ